MANKGFRSIFSDKVPCKAKLVAVGVAKGVAEGGSLEKMLLKMQNMERKGLSIWGLSSGGAHYSIIAHTRAGNPGFPQKVSSPEPDLFMTKQNR